MTDRIPDPVYETTPNLREFNIRRGSNSTRMPDYGWLMLVGLITRATLFGDTNYTNDEMFYFLVGQRAHDGLLPYVDIWDRKGPGLFFLTYLIAGFSRSVLAFQGAALGVAVATAICIYRMARLFADRRSATFAGTFYLAVLPLYGGGGGQSPIFYNLFMACGAYLVISAKDSLLAGRTPPRLFLAMVSAGFAITFKQSAFFEAAFLGLYAHFQLIRSPMRHARLAGTAMLMALAGVLPMATFGLAMALAGHLPEFLQAMVGANLGRTMYPPETMLMRAAQFVLYCSPALLLGVAGLSVRTLPTWPRRFLFGWLFAAFLGIASVPNFFDHYALPLMLPASVAASLALSAGRVGSRFAWALALAVLILGPALKWQDRQFSRDAMASLVRDIRMREPHPRLLVYEGPVYLYRLLDSYPPTPLLYPMHLFFPYEDNVSARDTADEMRRILAWKPNVVVMYNDYPATLENPRTSPLVRDYVSHCRFWFTREVRQVFATMNLAVYGNCSATDPDLSSDKVAISSSS